MPYKPKPDPIAEHENETVFGLTFDAALKTYKQGSFTVAAARVADQCMTDLWYAIAPAKRRQLLGSLNDLGLFISAAASAAQKANA